MDKPRCALALQDLPRGPALLPKQCIVDQQLTDDADEFLPDVSTELLHEAPEQLFRCGVMQTLYASPTPRLRHRAILARNTIHIRSP